MVDDNSDHYWAGVQRCFSRVAIVTALTTSTLAAQIPANTYGLDARYNDPAGFLRGPPEEDFWRNPLATRWPSPSIPQAQNTQGDEVAVQLEAGGQGPGWQFRSPGTRVVRHQVSAGDEPAGSLFGQYDEDFWVNPVAPVPLTFRPLSPSIGDEQEPAGSLFQLAPPEEDFWQNPVPTLWPPPRTPQAQITEGDEKPLGAEAGGLGPGQQYRSSGTRSVQYQFSPDDFLSGAAPATLADEDGWQNPLVQPANARTTVFASDDEVVTPPAPTIVEESPWQNPLIQQSIRSPQAVVDDEAAVGLFGQYDEDFWINHVRPAPLTFRPFNQWASDEQEPASTLFGQYDEDFWNSGVAPVPLTFRPFSQAANDEQEPAATLFGTDIENYWQNPQAFVQRQPAPVAAFAADDEITTPAVSATAWDGDEWAVSRPQAQRAPVTARIADDEIASVPGPGISFDDDGNGLIVALFAQPSSWNAVLLQTRNVWGDVTNNGVTAVKRRALQRGGD